MHVLQSIVADRSIEQGQRMIPVAARLNEQLVPAMVLDAHRRAVLFRLSTLLAGRVSAWPRKPTRYAYLIVETMTAVRGCLIEIDSERELECFYERTGHGVDGLRDEREVPSTYPTLARTLELLCNSPNVCSHSRRVSWRQNRIVQYLLSPSLVAMGTGKKTERTWHEL